MNEKAKKIYEQILQINESTATIAVSEMGFYPELRKLCESNACGAYGKNYTCPPLVGQVDDLIAKLKGYETAIIFRKAYELEDSFDFEGMEEGSAQFKELTYKVLEIAKQNDVDSLVLGAGGCRFCPKCGVVDNTPCRNPSKALSSLEANGIQVSELAGQVGMKYISGPNTVTYFGGVFVKA